VPKTSGKVPSIENPPPIEDVLGVDGRLDAAHQIDLCRRAAELQIFLLLEPDAVFFEAQTMEAQVASTLIPARLAATRSSPRTSPTS